MPASFLRIAVRKLAVALVAALPGTAAAQVETTTAPAAVIIDSSGSMAAREPDGRVKLDAARAVVEQALQKWPPGGRLAVVAYGHRRQSDCADIETIVPMGPVSGPLVHERLGALRARGKTPISQSLLHAAGLLPKGNAAIVLVSDGIETCEADPCGVAAALKKANPQLVIHVVGFGLGEGEAAQLSCIAENAGGRFFDAGTATDLASALTIVVETVAAEPPPEPAPAPEPGPPVVEALPPEPEPVPVPEPPRIVRVGLEAVAGDLGRIVDAPVRWSVRDAVGAVAYEGESRGLSLDLAEGRYAVEASAANARGSVTIEVTGEPGQSFDVPVEAGRLDLSLAAGGGAAPPFTDQEASGTVWLVEPMDGQGVVEAPKLARPSLLLAPGRYRVGASLKGLQATGEATVAVGAPTALSLDFRLGTLVLEAALGVEEPVLTEASMLGWRVGEGDKVLAIAGQARPRLVLQEGKYPVALSISGAEVSAAAEVLAGEERVLRVIVGGGELMLSARLGPQSPAFEDWRDAYWSLTAEEGPAAGKVIDLPAATATVPVPPGRWRVALQSGTVTAERDIAVAPGDSLTVSFTLDAARLTVRPAPAAGIAAMNTVVSVLALGSDGAPDETPAFAGGTSDEVSTIVRAGRWRIVAEDSEGRRAEADIDLGVGEERILELRLE